MVWRWVWAACVCYCLVGCAGYKDGSRRTPGEFTDDVAIQAAVKTKLIRAKEIKGLRINVDVNRGIVTLLGKVPSEAIRQRAGELSAEVKGVKSVDNQLRIKEG